MPKSPNNRAGSVAKGSKPSEVDAFLDRVRAMPPRPAGDGRRGRLIFALDATASRQPTWDRACHLQSEMFQAAASLGGLEVQLVFYRGFRECQASRWTSDSASLLRLMNGVSCLGGQTQIERVLGHALKESGRGRVDAMVFVGDSMEEDIDAVCHRAGKLGLRKVPVFLFHEGGDPVAGNAFQQIARLTGGASCPFDAASANQLRQLLGAVAAYAAGGRQALLAYGKQAGGAALRLTHQVSGKP